MTREVMNLKDFINESLVNESTTEFAFVWDHYEPDILYCCTGDIRKLGKLIKDYDFESFTTRLKSNIIGVAWNDEYGFAWDIDGRDLDDAKRKDLKYIEDQINQHKDQIEQEQYMYIESNIFGGANEWYDDDVSTDAKEIQTRFMDIIENSEVDKDSMYGRAIVDIKKGDVLLSGSVNINFLSAEEFIEQYLTEE